MSPSIPSRAGSPGCWPAGTWTGSADATFWRAGTRVLPKVEGKVRRRSYKPGWRRLSFGFALGGGVAESGYLTTRDLDATRETLT
ncbi:hypothetical protein N7925_00165 [Streptomyces sp. CA-278952]|uniref:hypothetical protein n=1 Tax=Streptomyces sp. CA-278952 TaxID=2980556 RepID=UPI00236895A8|nr:hypothetical protein [Streptomyces sp. CA-278952]WDG26854.1 hypothetical protein N7925_00165 [Streptomyces sp. CA-278952]